MGRFADPHINRTCLQRKRPSENGPTQPRVQSLTDFKYTLSLTRGVLEAKGLPSPPVFTGGHPSLAVDELKSPDALITLLQNARPVVDLGHEKATQLLAVFKNEIYPLYPCISLELAQDSVDSLFSLLSRVPHSATCNVEIIDVEIMKSVMAVALLTRDDMQSPLATDLESQLLWSVGSCLDQEHPQIEDIIMATLLVSVLAGLTAAGCALLTGSCSPQVTVFRPQTQASQGVADGRSRREALSRSWHSSRTLL